MPIIFGLLLIFIIWFQYEKRKSSKEEAIEKDAFLKRESQANLVRKRDISSLNYINLPSTGLPLKKGQDKVTNCFIETYLSFVDKKIINLSHFSNTELKEKFGLANLSLLSQYDENFFSLAKLLNDWGLHLLEKNRLQEAAQVLEFALLIKTELSESYISLATVYQKQEHPEKITEVKAAYSALTEHPSKKVLTQLDKLVFEALVETDTKIDDIL